MLSDKQKAEYLKSGGSRCPYCTSDNLEADRTEADDRVAWANVRCLDCEMEWQDIYTLTDIEEQT